MRVGIVAKRGNRRAAFLAADIRDRLQETGVDVWVDDATAAEIGNGGHPVDEMDACDLLVSIGGDGTFLFTARDAGGTPIVGVNLGEVGFLNAIGPEDAVSEVLDVVESYRNDEMTVSESPRLAARGEGWASQPATNEVVVQGPQRGHGGGVGVEVRVDGSLYTGGRADGVLVATPTGSTAYNLSEGGPLVHPDLDALVVTEMCASGGMPPLTIDADSEVTVTLTDAETGYVVSDGRVVRDLDLPAEVSLATTEPPVRMAGPEVDFFEALEKLE